MLRQTFDTVANTMYLQVSDRAVERTIEVTSDVYVDLAADGSPVGVEVLGLVRGGRLYAPESVASVLTEYRFPEQARAVMEAARPAEPVVNPASTAVSA